MDGSDYLSVAMVQGNFQDDLKCGKQTNFKLDDTKQTKMHKKIIVKLVYINCQSVQSNHHNKVVCQILRERFANLVHSHTCTKPSLLLCTNIEALFSLVHFL